MIKYQFVYRLFYHAKLKNNILFPLLGCIFVILPACAPLPFYKKYVLIVFCTLVCLFLQLNDIIRIRLRQLLVLFFFASCMDEINTLFIQSTSFYRLLVPKMSGLSYIACNLIDLSFLSIAFIIRKQCAKRERQYYLSKFRDKMIYLIIAMSIGMLFIVTGLDYAKEYVPNNHFGNFVFLSCIFAYICIGMMVLFFIYIRNTNQEMEENIRQKQQLMEMQTRYYTALLEKEKDTRKYRHDMTNHLLCLDEFLIQRDFVSAHDYIAGLEHDLEQIRSRCYDTGNQTTDAITNYYLPMIEQSAKIQIKGHLNENPGIDNLQLCTIYGNLLQNAVEEVMRTKSVSDAFLEIILQEGTKYLKIEIKNSISESTQTKLSLDHTLQSQKEDLINHGFGLKNVERTVAGLAGQFDIKVEDDIFHVSVVLKKHADNS